MSVRKFGVLLRGLPSSARAWADTNGRWTNTDHLLALNAELMHLVHLGTARFKGTRPPPLHIPRPGEKKPKPVGFGGLARALMGGG